MTIYLYSGTPGSGKSYCACRMIYRTLKSRKQDVIANFEVNADTNWAGNFWYLPNDRLTVESITDFARWYWQDHEFREDGILVVLDEAQLLWNSRNWMDKQRMKWLELWSQHRKYGLKIVLVAQADIMIDKQFRTLIEYEVNHRKVGNYGAFGKLLKVFSFSQLFYEVTYFYAQKYKVDGQFIRYSKKIGQMYNSYKAFDQMQQLPAQIANT